MTRTAESSDSRSAKHRRVNFRQHLPRLRAAVVTQAIQQTRRGFRRPPAPFRYILDPHSQKQFCGSIAAARSRMFSCIADASLRHFRSTPELKTNSDEIKLAIAVRSNRHRQRLLPRCLGV